MGLEALRQYEELERLLDETWGEKPSLRVREAIEAAFEDSRAGKHNLPAQLTSFIGREVEIAEACELLGNTRLLTLTGSGGCGKTRLSLQVAERVLDRYRDGVWFVEFAPLADPGLVAGTVAAAMGLAESLGETIEETLLEHLKTKRLLLVLDNCEHLLVACAQLVERFLCQCPSVSILATSRERMALGAEALYRVPSLSLPAAGDAQSVADLCRHESVQLFVERSRQVRRDFAAIAQNSSALASICRRLDGIPLAIELAAARMRSMSLEELNVGLDDRFRLLTGGSRTALPRQQTLRSLIDWSYDQLSEHEKALFRRLAVFVGGWHLESAEQVCVGGTVERSKVLDLLTSLGDKSMVVSEELDGRSRFRMLETLWQYARDRLSDSGEAKSWESRHLSHYLELAEDAEPHLGRFDDDAWLQRLDLEHDNLRAALARSLAPGGDGESGLRLAGALWRFWSSNNHLTEGRAWLASALASNPGAQAKRPRGKALLGAGHLAWRQGHYRAARSPYEESLAISREVGDRAGIADSLHGLGNLASLAGDNATGWELHRESLAIKRELGDQPGIAASLNCLGVVARDRGDLEAARAMLEESLTAWRILGERAAVALALLNLGRVDLEEGDIPAAQAKVQESLATWREVDSRSGIGFCLLELGHVSWHQGDWVSARARYLEAMELWGDQTDADGVANVLESIALTLASANKVGDAARLGGAAERIREALGKPQYPIDHRRYEQHLAKARKATGDDEAFDRAWQEGRSLTIDQAIELALRPDI